MTTKKLCATSCECRTFFDWLRTFVAALRLTVLFQIVYSYCSAISTVIVINVFYTFPITFASAYGSEQFTELFPGLNIDQQSLNGLIRGWLLNFFLA